MKAKSGNHGCEKYKTAGWRLFTSKGSAADTLVITAHGAETRQSIDGASFGYKHWKPVFVFFSSKGHSVNAEELGLVASRANSIGPNEHIGGYEVQRDTTPFEYELSKFQGKHGNDFETYDSIQRNIKSHLKEGNSYDVLTVRNRKKGFYKNNDVHLSDILSWLNQENLHYKTIVCSFCRSDVAVYRNMLTGEAFV